MYLASSSGERMTALYDSGKTSEQLLMLKQGTRSSNVRRIRLSQAWKVMISLRILASSNKRRFMENGRYRWYKSIHGTTKIDLVKRKAWKRLQVRWIDKRGIDAAGRLPKGLPKARHWILGDAKVMWGEWQLITLKWGRMDCEVTNNEHTLRGSW